MHRDTGVEFDNGRRVFSRYLVYEQHLTGKFLGSLWQVRIYLVTLKKG